MIVSHRHRFIFFAVPKTATHALRQGLAVQLGPDDWEQQNLFAERRLPVPALAAIRHGHISAIQAAEHLPAAVWREYFRFAFVRNPFDRFVSTCFFLHRREPDFARRPAEHMKRVLHYPRFRQRVLVRPQAELLTGPDGRLAVDYLGRFEALQESWDGICERLALPSSMLEVRNPSEHGDWRQYYDGELRAIVESFYEADLDAFGYAFDEADAANRAR